MGHGDMGNGEMGNGHVDPHPLSLTLNPNLTITPDTKLNPNPKQYFDNCP